MSVPTGDPTAPTRRQRGREATLLEIKAAALDELRRHGSRGVTMRGVARSIDMTPSGLYRYFEDHGALLAALCVDAHDSLADALDQVRSSTEGLDRAAAWFEGSLALRTWALENVDEYGLVFGPPVWGTTGPHPSVREAASRLLGIAVGVVEQADRDGQLVGRGDPSRVRRVALGGVAALAGVISLETYGHLDGPATGRDGFYRAYSRQVMSGMGFTPSSLEALRAQVTPGAEVP